MFTEVSNVCEVPSVTNFVTFEFHHSTNSKAVIFFCIPKKLGIRLKFIVQPRELVKSVAGLLKSFQSTVVLANKIQEPVGSKMKKMSFPMKCDLLLLEDGLSRLPVKTEDIDHDINEDDTLIEHD